jgi:hypothetical protein
LNKKTFRAGFVSVEIMQINLAAIMPPKTENPKMTTPIKIYDTKADALAIKAKLDGGTYYLAHGEYERPDYSVRKIRGGDGYYLHARYYYFPGTFYARTNGPLLAH